MKPQTHRNPERRALRGWAAVRALAGGVFVMSGFLKLIEPPQNFLYVIQSYRILPGFAERPAAVMLPWAELVTGAFLAAGLWFKAASRSLWALHTLFTLAVIFALVRALPIKDCGCFGGLVSLPLEAVLVLDLVLWGVLAALALKPGADAFGLDRALGGR